MANIYFINTGTDAGGWFIDSHGKVHPIPGWQPDVMIDVARAVNVIREASQLKTPGLREATMKSALEFVQKELRDHIKEGGVLVVE
jgi:hypothetical protein